MPDIAMCCGWYHDECKTCYRRVAKPAMMQCYIDPPRKSPCYLYLYIEDYYYVKPHVRRGSKQQPQS
jgi:hypothetical protein